MRGYFCFQLQILMERLSVMMRFARDALQLVTVQNKRLILLEKYCLKFYVTAQSELLINSPKFTLQK